MKRKFYSHDMTLIAYTCAFICVYAQARVRFIFLFSLTQRREGEEESPTKFVLFLFIISLMQF